MQSKIISKSSLGTSLGQAPFAPETNRTIVAFSIPQTADTSASGNKTGVPPTLELRLPKATRYDRPERDAGMLSSENALLCKFAAQTSGMPNRVAIITRTRDRLPLLRRAIESVLAQTYSEWTHVIVNDGGSADDLDAFLREYSSRYAGRLAVLHMTQCVGMQNASNAGIKQSESTFVTIHDDDDSWQPGFLTACVAYLSAQGAESRYQGVITHSLKVTEEVQSDGTIIECNRKPYVPLDEISFFRVGYENPFPPIAFVYRRSVHDTIGYFNQRWEEAGDFDFNIRFLQHYEIGVVREPLANYHFRTAKSGSFANSQVLRTNETHRRVVEIKNHYMRGEASDIPPTTALALQIAYFLVENQWKTASNYEAINRIDQSVHQLRDELTGDAYRDKFTTLREAFAQVLDLLQTLDAANQDIAGAIGNVHADLVEKTAHHHADLVEKTTYHHTDLAEKTTDAHHDLANKLNRLLAIAEENEKREKNIRTLWQIGPFRLAIDRTKQNTSQHLK